MFDLWFPYDSGQMDIFESPTGLKDTFAIGQVETSNAYDAKQGCYSSDNGCSAWKDISSFGKMDARYVSSADWNGKSLENHCSFQLYDFRAEGADISDTGIVFLIPPANYQSHYFAELTLNGKSYNNFQVIKRDSSGLKEGIYKVYIARGIGLVAYEYYPSEIVFINN